MKNILLLAFLLTCIPSVAQKQPQLSILTFSGDVTIGGQPVVAGQLVYDDSKNLLINGNGSYVNILTETGYARRLGKGSYSPEYVNLGSPRAKPGSEKGMHYYPPRLDILTAPERGPIKIFGDSVFLLWKFNDSRQPAPITISILNPFEDHLLDTTTQQSFCVLGVAPFFLRETLVIIDVTSAIEREVRSLRKMDEAMRMRIQNDLQTLTANTETERAIARVAIFEINELTFDVTYGLYKLRMAEKAAGVLIVSNYYQRLLKKYGMDTL